MALSCTVFDVFDFKKSCDVEIRVRESLKVIDTGIQACHIQLSIQLAYGFLLATYSNIVFLRRDAMHSVDCAAARCVCLSVRLLRSWRYCKNGQTYCRNSVTAS